MRLISVHTLEFAEFVDPPPYAILSHRWTGYEITYEQYLDPLQRSGPGYQKVAAFCAYIKNSYYAVKWAWVDTCCIDKKSSAELSEAINSMWNWYWNCKICIAYLSDVSAETWQAELHNSKWLVRGWTLQELLAPQDVIFCDKYWQKIGSKSRAGVLRDILTSVTGIPERYLVNRELIWEASVARRMSWASRRRTTRQEDIAYSLFGLFQINLPLIYGEGPRAFLRLQEEIIRRSDDESILTWSLPDSSDTGVLAPHPACFADSGTMMPLEVVDRPPLAITSRGIQIHTALEKVQDNLYLLQLNCASVTGTDSFFDFRARLIQDKKIVDRDKRVVHSCMIPLKKVGTSTFVRSHVNSKNTTATPRQFDPTFVRSTLQEKLYYLQHVVSPSSLATSGQAHRATAKPRDLGQKDLLWQRDEGLPDLSAALKDPANTQLVRANMFDKWPWISSKVFKRPDLYIGREGEAPILVEKKEAGKGLPSWVPTVLGLGPATFNRLDKNLTRSLLMKILDMAEGSDWKFPGFAPLGRRPISRGYPNQRWDLTARLDNRALISRWRQLVKSQSTGSSMELAVTLRDSKGGVSLFTLPMVDLAELLFTVSNALEREANLLPGPLYLHGISLRPRVWQKVPEWTWYRWESPTDALVVLE